MDTFSPETSGSQVCAPGHPTLLMVLSVLGWMVPCLCQHHCSLAISPLARMRSVVELCPMGLEKHRQKNLYTLLGAATRQAWAMPETRTTEDTNLSQSRVLFSVQPIYIHYSCYFFPTYMDVSCSHYLPSFLREPSRFLHVCPGRHTASSLVA